MRVHVAVPAILVLVVAGCVTPAADVAPASAGDVPLIMPSALPVFGERLVLGDPEPAGLGGEPSVAVAPDGTIYVAAPLIIMRDLATGIVGAGDAGQIRVWRSTDGGASFELLNDENGRLTPDGDGNGDADISVGPDGSVYAIDLGDGVPLYISRDNGTSWENKGALNDEDTVTDRQWIDAEGDLIAVTWANQSAEDWRGLDITLSTDRGETWTKPTPLVDGMIQLGPVEIAPGGVDVYMPYVKAESWDLVVLASHDAGATWTEHGTGHTHPRPSTLGLPLPLDPERRWSPTFLFPVMAADKAGHLYLAFSEYRDGDETVALLLMRSDDKGATWTEPVEIASAPNAVFPWIVAGDEGQVAVSYLASDLPVDPSKGPHSWRVEIAVSRDAHEAATFEVAHAFEGVHTGSICAKGGGCAGGLVHNAAYEDRALLDFFEMAITSEGKLVVVWTQTEGDGGRQPRVMFAAQTEGDGLLGWPVPAP